MKFDFATFLSGIRRAEAGAPSVMHLVTEVGKVLQSHEGATQEAIEIGAALIADAPTIAEAVMADPPAE